jgi:RNA recognition motif-containing protein
MMQIDSLNIYCRPKVCGLTQECIAEKQICSKKTDIELEKHSGNLKSWQMHHLRFRKNAIHVRNLPSIVDKDSLMDYFRKFGKIITIELSYREVRSEKGKPRYCLVITRDLKTYEAILSFQKHNLRGIDIFCTPCVKGSKSLSLLNKLNQSKKIILKQRFPSKSCFEFGDFKLILQPYTAITNAHYIKNNSLKYSNIVGITLQNTEDVDELLSIRSLSGELRGRKYFFDIERYKPPSQKGGSTHQHDKPTQASGNIEDLNSVEFLSAGESIPRKPKNIFPPFHRFLPCQVSYYLKRPKYGGSLLVHHEENLRFNRERMIKLRRIETEALAPIPQARSALRYLSDYVERVEGSIQSSPRTLTPSKEDEHGNECLRRQQSGAQTSPLNQ